MSSESKISQEVTEKATELHKVEQRIPKIQRSLDGADVRDLTRVASFSSNLGCRKNSTQLLPLSRRMKENTKTSEISIILWRRRKL